MSKPVVLIIDDEEQIRKLLTFTLQSNGYAPITAEHGADGVQRAAMDRPELIILDLGLPDLDGKEVLQRIREWSRTPIMILSVRNSEEEIVACLDAGADDYLVKPFRTHEFLARVRAALRHVPATSEETVFTAGDLTVDLTTRTVLKGGEKLKLTATEYALLALFVRHAGRVLTHRFILENVWGPAQAEETQYTRVYVGALRKKIEDDPSQPALIVTESRIGYRLTTEEDR
jgi:two-component system, OmpR family, KDP operon response regulator KdpE